MSQDLTKSCARTRGGGQRASGVRMHRRASACSPPGHRERYSQVPPAPIRGRRHVYLQVASLRLVCRHGCTGARVHGCTRAAHARRARAACHGTQEDY